MLIFWNLPISSDGRYLATSVSSRESGYSYLRSVADATGLCICITADRTVPRRSLDRYQLIAERKR
jgi:hypothetical protein